ncbi:MFS transporter [Eubacteriales bacterium OttesenSCG-928-N13]|nr:MFS transporter [Eubacteriales bacterium OttesenSCG-928-N13]
MNTIETPYVKQTLKGRNFLLMVVGQIISLFGNSIIRFALPLYILQQTGSAAMFGMVSALSFLPMIVMSLIGGIVADRVNKQRIMVVLDFLTAGLVLGFILLNGRVDAVLLVVVVLMILYGIQGAYTPAVQASIPMMMQEDKIMQANAVINLVSSFSGLLGPVIGGMLFGLYGLVPIVTIGCISFFVSAVMELFIRIPHVRQRKESSVMAIVRGDLKQSFRFIVRQKPIILRVLIIVFLFNLCFSCLMIVGLPVIITQTLGISTELYGITQGLMAAGGIVGGALMGVLAKKMNMQSMHRLLIGCVMCLIPAAICLLVGAPTMVTYTCISAGSFLGMALATMFTVQIMSYVQMETPTNIVGKVISTVMAISICAQPIGQAVYGMLFERLRGSDWAIMLAAAGVSLLISLYSKAVFRGFDRKNAYA